MRQLNIIFSIVLFSFLFSSCSNKINKQPIIALDNEKTAISLNNGDKWIINKEMTPHIKQAELILEAYIPEKDNYALLAISLEKQNNFLISSCTMKGKSHDELHKWLHPHIALVEELSKTKSLQEADMVIVKLKKSFSIFNQYFQ